MKKVIALFFLGLFIPHTALAEVPLQVYTTADPANKPNLTQTSIGIPAVNITDPDSHGVSMNEFNHYNVGPNGLVHNNSMQDGFPALGGFLAKNSNLSQSAQTIAVHVPSGNPTYLNGPTEVFGNAANMVIYNPYLIKINGASYINTPKVTHAAGVPLRYEDGRLGADITAGGMIYIGNTAIPVPPGQKHQIFADVIINFKQFMGTDDVTMRAGQQTVDLSTDESTFIEDDTQRTITMDATHIAFHGQQGLIYIDLIDEGGAD